MKDDFYAEAYNTTDMFDKNDNYTLNSLVNEQANAQRAAVVDQMRAAIESSAYNYDNRAMDASNQLPNQRTIQPRTGFSGTDTAFTPSGAPATTSGFESPAVVQPDIPVLEHNTTIGPTASNKDKQDKVFISLH